MRREHQNEFLLFDFFAIRPVFTLYGLRVLWGIYLIDQALPFVTIFTNPNISAAAAGPIIAIFLRACLNIVVFRLLSSGRECLVRAAELASLRLRSQIARHL